MTAPRAHSAERGRPWPVPQCLGPRGAWVRLLLTAALLFGAASGSWAAQRALLVGVSELLHQPPALWLQAPRNDVRLLREALVAQGFDKEHIWTLADGVPGAGLPESAQIHAGLQRLLESSRSGDFVLLYFSGHGTRLRDTRKRYQEPDGLAEHFLAREVRAIGGESASVAGGLRDVDVDAWVQAFLAKNVFVAAVFDTCAAASMTRGRAGAPEADPVAAGPQEDEVRWRGLPATQLQARAVAPVPPIPLVPVTAHSVPRARYVALFASESHQVTPELRLPRGSRQAQPQGLLTWALVQSLARKPGTWRELFDGVLALYPPVLEELAQRFPTRELPSPVAEGNLDAPLFSNPAGPLLARPLWRARRAGAELVVSAGTLDGAVSQQQVWVQAALEDGTQRTAPAQLQVVAMEHARLPVPAPLAGLPGQPLWSVQPAQVPLAWALRVHSDGALPAGLALDYPASVVQVERDADVRLTRSGAYTQLQVLDASWGRAAVRIPAADVALLRRRLEGLARLKWFHHLHAQAQGAEVEGLEVRLEAWAGERLQRGADARDAERAGVLPLRAQEQARLHVRNSSGHSLDLIVLGIDAQGELRPIYPADVGESNRFERGTRETPSAKRFDLPWLSEPGARLWVLATPSAAQQGPRLFGAGPTELLADVRVRGSLQPEPRRAVYAVWVNGAGASSAAR